jgi:hypothetical protein
MRLRFVSLLIGFVDAALLLTAEAKTLFEFSVDQRSPRDEVGTCMYTPTDMEKPFFDRLSEDDQVTLNSKDGADQKETFSLQGHDGKFVSWSGIVRGITRAKEGRQGTLLIENKYFAGLGDCHIQTVEIGGAGDFLIALDEIPEELIPLVLIRVYGVVQGKDADRPVVKPEYVRIWHWGQFNFTDVLGEDRGNPEWKKRMRLPGGEPIYHIGVSPKYYSERLGPTDDEWDQIKAYHRGETWIELSREPYETKTGAAAYTPTEEEQQFFDRLASQDRITVESKPQETEHAKFQLRGHVHQFASWFGIIREATPSLSKPGGTLVIESKYFKGSGDQNLQTISLRGGGDFKAQLTSFSEDFAPLCLVRIYGNVLREEGELPVIEASYVRIWDVRQYNFDDYGVDRTNKRWTSNLRLKSSESVYASKVSADYYINRLGPTAEEAQKIKVLFMSDEERQKYYQERDKAKASPSPAK